MIPCGPERILKELTETLYHVFLLTCTCMLRSHIWFDSLSATIHQKRLLDVKIGYKFDHAFDFGI